MGKPITRILLAAALAALGAVSLIPLRVQADPLADPLAGSSCSIPTGVCAGCSISCSEGRAAICQPGEISYTIGFGWRCDVQPRCYCN